MRVTVQRIGEKAGVSKMTVSRALRGVGHLSDETRTRIRHIAREMGHPQMDRIVTSSPLHRGHTDHRLVLLLPTFHPNDVDAPLGQELLAGTREALTKWGGSLEIKPCASLEDVVRVWEDSPAQALMLRRQLPSVWIERLRQIGPVVYGAAFDCQRGVDCVYTNEHRAAGSILDLLSRYGHRDVFWFGLNDLNREDALPRALFDQSTVMDRLTASNSGVRYAAWANLARGKTAEEPWSLLILDRDWQRESLDEVMARGVDQILGRNPRPTAIVVASNSMALALLPVLRRRGVRVPRDLSVVSYSGSLESRGCSPQLTSAQLPMRAIGRAIPELVERRLANPDAPPVSMQLEAEMLVGETIGLCPQAN